MDKLREIALTFCAVSVFTAAAGILKGRALFKSGKYIIGLVFICSLISCFKDISFSFEDLTNMDNNTSFEGEETAFSEYGAEYLIGGLLRQNSLRFREISAKATKNESDIIIINEITVYGAEDEEGVMAVLGSFGIDCRVIFR